jgi:Cu/Ag efflux protein CusF
MVFHLAQGMQSDLGRGRARTPAVKGENAMRKLSVGILAAVLVLGVSVAAYAAAPATHSASGTITAIDTSARAISVKTKAGQEVFNLGDKTELMSSGNAITLQELKEGDQVEVTYTKSGSTLNATKIVVKTSGDRMPPAPQSSSPSNSESNR